MLYVLKAVAWFLAHLPAMLLWGKFGIIVETLWTMLRKFKRRFVRLSIFKPLHVLLARAKHKFMRTCYRPLRKRLAFFVPQKEVNASSQNNVPKRDSGRTKGLVPPSHRSPFSLHTETNGWTYIMFSTGMPLLLGLSEYLLQYHVPRYVRFSLYALGFWGAELLWGSLIKALGARVPWDYSASRWSACGGLIRLDYFFAWGTLGLAVEQYFSYWINVVLVSALIQGWQHMPAPFPAQ